MASSISQYKHHSTTVPPIFIGGQNLAFLALLQKSCYGTPPLTISFVTAITQWRTRRSACVSSSRSCLNMTAPRGNYDMILGRLWSTLHRHNEDDFAGWPRSPRRDRSRAWKLFNWLPFSFRYKSVLLLLLDMYPVSENAWDPSCLLCIQSVITEILQICSICIMHQATLLSLRLEAWGSLNVDPPWIGQILIRCFERTTCTQCAILDHGNGWLILWLSSYCNIVFEDEAGIHEQTDRGKRDLNMIMGVPYQSKIPPSLQSLRFKTRARCRLCRYLTMYMSAVWPFLPVFYAWRSPFWTCQWSITTSNFKSQVTITITYADLTQKSHNPSYVSSCVII